MKLFAVLLLAVGAFACDDTNPLNDEYCYIELDVKSGIATEYSCRCPWSTCERNDNIISPLYDCKLTGTAIALLVVGSVVGCLLIVLCIFCCVKQGKCCCYAQRTPATTVYVPYNNAQPPAGQQLGVVVQPAV